MLTFDDVVATHHVVNGGMGKMALAGTGAGDAGVISIPGYSTGETIRDPIGIAGAKAFGVFHGATALTGEAIGKDRWRFVKASGKHNGRGVGGVGSEGMAIGGGG